MTAQQPQRYCITQYQIDFIRNAAFTDREKCSKVLSEIEDEPCTRPHTPAPDPLSKEGLTISALCGYEAGYADGERTATLATRDDLKQWFIKNKCNGCSYGGNLLDKIKSLRSTTAQEGIL